MRKFLVLLLLLCGCRDEPFDEDSVEVRQLRVEEAKAWVKLHESRVVSANIDRQLDLIDLEMKQHTYEHVIATKDAFAAKFVKETEVAYRKARLALQEDVTQLQEVEAELEVAKVRLKLAEAGVSSFYLKTARKAKKR